VLSGQTTGKLNQYLQIKDSLDFIVFGSSRANHNIDPQVISENSFNAGVDGQKIAFSGALVKILSNKKQTLLFHIDPAYATDSTYEGEDLKSLKIQYNKNKIIKNEIDRLDMANPLQNFYWCVAYSGKVLGIIKNYFKPNYDYRTYSGFDPIVVGDVQQAIFEKRVEHRKIDSCARKSYKMNPIYNFYLDELKAFSTENKKTLIFFTSPELNDFCKADNIFFKTAMEDKGLTYYDFTELYTEKPDYSDWKDFTHLSNVGAKKFTKSLSKVIFGEK